MICVVVQAVPNRGEAWERSKASIEASDIGNNYKVMVNPPDIPVVDFFISVLSALYVNGAEWALRLEDDAIVNRHILHNVMTWPDRLEPDFGAGWLFGPVYSTGRWHRPDLHGSVGVLLKRNHIQDYMKICIRMAHEEPTRTDQDLMLSRAVWETNRRLYIPSPSLVEHPIDVPSTLGHVHTPLGSTTHGRFDLEWRRSESSPPPP